MSRLIAFVVDEDNQRLIKDCRTHFVNNLTAHPFGRARMEVVSSSSQKPLTISSTATAPSLSTSQPPPPASAPSWWPTSILLPLDSIADSLRSSLAVVSADLAEFTTTIQTDATAALAAGAAVAAAAASGDASATEAAVSAAADLTLASSADNVQAPESTPTSTSSAPVLVPAPAHAVAAAAALARLRAEEAAATWDDDVDEEQPPALRSAVSEEATTALPVPVPASESTSDLIPDSATVTSIVVHAVEPMSQPETASAIAATDAPTFDFTVAQSRVPA